MTIALSILPIFPVIVIGLVGQRLGLLPDEFLKAGNRLAFNLAIPALIFRAIATTPLDAAFQPVAAGICLAAMLVAWVTAWAVSGWLFDPEQGHSRATWIQSSLHGNQGILGLAVIFYGLGEAGLATVGLIVTAIIVAQNVMSVVTLSRWGSGKSGGRALVKAVAFNPIIIATTAGLVYSFSGLHLPGFVDRTLQILAGLGLPLALLIVGATLGTTSLRAGGMLRLGVLAAMKLLVVPLFGLALFWLTGQSGLPAAVSLILLSSPSATICVILSAQLGGDPRLASAAISLTHALSAITYILWLHVAGALF